MKKVYSALLCALISGVSLGQESVTLQDTTKHKITQLDEIIITGNFKKDPIHTIVANNYEEKIVQPKNVADIFSDINGFSVIKRGNYAIDPSFRASQYEQLNIQYDGGTKAMHACPNRMDPITTHVIPEEISKIEIIKGPYTVRYGATFGGIVNLVTQKTNYLKKGVHGKVSTGYETNGNSMINILQLQYIEDKYDLVGNVGYRDFGSYEDGDGVEIPTSFRSIDYGLKLGYNFTDNQRLQAHWRQSFGRDVQHAGLAMDTEYDDSSILSLDYKIENISKVINSFSAKAYYSYVDHLMTNFKRPTYANVSAKSSVESTTIGGKVEINWQPAQNISIFSGVDAMTIARDGGRTRMMQSNNSMAFNDKIWQDSYVNDYGIFTEAKWSINPVTVLTAGMRYDLVNSDIQDPEADFAAYYDLEEKTDHNISSTLSIKHLVSDNFTLEVAYGRGVRSANMIERYINHFTVGQDSYEYLGNPNLDPEVNNQFEIGFKGKTGQNSFNYAASFYYSKFENYIVAVVDPSITRKFMPMAEPKHVKVFRNLDNAYKSGFELMGQINFLEDYYFKTELAYVYAKNNDLNESLPLTPPLTTVLSLGMNRDKYWAKVQYNISSKQDKIAESFGETTTPGYETLDVKFGIKPIKNLTLGLAALNVFDKTYSNHLNFSFNNQSDFDRIPITEAGRNFSIFVQYGF